MKPVTRVMIFILTIAPIVSAGQTTIKLEVTFERGGSDYPSPQQVLHETNECVRRYVPQKDGYDPYVLRSCITASLASYGYLQPEIGTATTGIGASGVTRVTVPVNRGMRYRLGGVDIKGSRLFSSQQLLKMFDLKTGEVASRDVLYNWLEERVKAAYAEWGHIQYDFEATTVLRPATAGTTEGIVDFKITIYEGPRFVVRKIQFVGNERTPIHVFRSAFSLREGETFIRSKYQKSLTALNRLGLFEPLDEKDVELRAIARDLPQLDILVHLKEKVRK